MKNVMKKVFSLLLVGVVAVSMFGFIAPTRAEASEENSKGKIILHNTFDDEMNYTVSFTDYNGHSTTTNYILSHDFKESVSISYNTRYVHIDINNRCFMFFEARFEEPFGDPLSNTISVVGCIPCCEGDCWLEGPSVEKI